MINQTTLKQVIAILRENKIRCGIGGSFLLQIYRLYDDPDDVDFWVTPEDMGTVRNLFQSYEQYSPKIQLPPEYHLKIRFYDIDVDFVACFMTKPNSHAFVYNISPQNIEMVQMENGDMMPCTSLEDWYIVYKLLKREDKAAIIRRYIYHRDSKKTNKRLELMARSETNKLPRKVLQDIYDFIYENMQISLAEWADENNG